MKIRTKLALLYSSATAVLLLLLMIAIYVVSERNRSASFFLDLKKEGITKANLFLRKSVGSELMQSIYMNNRMFINEVEVALYDTTGRQLYHDTKESMMMHEGSTLVRTICEKGSVELYHQDVQVAGLLYQYDNVPYVITAAAVDGLGYSQQRALVGTLILFYVSGLVILILVGLLLAKQSLSPVAQIVKEVEALTVSDLTSRIGVRNEKDELGELAVTFNQMLDRVEHSFTSQKMFVSNVSHELRTPMSSLISEVELALLKERTVPEYQEVLGNVLLDAHKIVRLLKGLLHLAEADFQPEQMKGAQIRLDELLLDTREMLLKNNPSFKVELIFEQESDDESMITVWGNAYLLRVAFINLMENNCKFSSDSTSRVRISFLEGRSIVRFSDNGIGIPPEDLKHIYKPFYRGINKSFVSGNGIGLPLTKKIITTHQGSIDVISQVDEGTVFTVSIPHV